VVSGGDLVARARAALAEVCDPELPQLSIADLGILRGVEHDGDGVEVVITPTYSGCPAMAEITADIRRALDEAGIASVRVRTVLAPPWTTDWLSAEGRRKLAAAGIAPPERQAPLCPLCASKATELISPFGATACKALWRCTACREPFDAFKCH
jgi:ring-1,2-phenylacetyl-CoA epoxidase subunit PaaD